MFKVKLQSEYDDLDKYEYDGGDTVYCKKNANIWHNPYGPAIIWRDGSRFYYINSKCHRLDGPAIMYSDGDIRYYINNEYLSKEEFEMHPERLKFLGKEYLICLT